jgi:hypothetical protein
VSEGAISRQYSLQAGPVLRDHSEEACIFGIWMKFALDTSMLAFETQQVIGLRLLKLTLGGPVDA